MLLLCLVSKSQNYTDTTYFADGNIRTAGYFNQIDSMWTVYHYYQNGQLKTIEPLSGDGYTPIGQRTCFNPNGNIAYIMTYKNGNQFGPFIQFYLDGNIKTKGNFYNGFKAGKWTEYDEKCSIISTTTYFMTKSDSTSNPLGNDTRITDLEIKYGFMSDGHLTSGTFLASDIFRILEPKKKK